MKAANKFDVLNRSTAADDLKLEVSKISDLHVFIYNTKSTSAHLELKRGFSLNRMKWPNRSLRTFIQFVIILVLFRV